MSQFLGDNPSDPHAFVQWKGTDVCMDFHCECGTHCHFDGDFAYTVKCPTCLTVWEMPCYIVPRKSVKGGDNYWHDNPKLLETDDE